MGQAPPLQGWQSAPPPSPPPDEEDVSPPESPAPLLDEAVPLLLPLASPLDEPPEELPDDELPPLLPLELEEASGTPLPGGELLLHAPIVALIPTRATAVRVAIRIVPSTLTGSVRDFPERLDVSSTLADGVLLASADAEVSPWSSARAISWSAR